jgi:integrase/recombinase XerD
VAGVWAMMDFCEAASDYLATRRAMGYKLVSDSRLVKQFASHLDARGATHLTIAEATAWAKQPQEVASVWWTARLRAVRGFARYLVALDPATEVPPADLLREPDHRIVPYIYSDQDIEQLIEAAGRLPKPHRADTYQTLIGLLAVTGMRVGEAVRLDRADVDLDEGTLTIRDSKFGKSRQLILHTSSTKALAAYAQRRDERRTRAKSPSFFTSTTGTRLLRDNVSTVGPRLVRAAGLRRRGPGRPPRLHDLRHSFAVRCLVRWYREGLEVEQRLPLLSTWMGHVCPANTYWYLTGVPELMELVAARLDARTEGER